MAYGTRNLQPARTDIAVEEEFLAVSREVSKAITMIREKKTLHEELVNQLIRNELYGDALVHIEELLLQSPKDARLHYLYALVMATIEQHNSETQFDAQTIRFHYEQAVVLEPSNYSYGYAYAIYLIYEEVDYGAALDVCRQLIAVNSNDPRGYFLLGQIEYALGDIPAALEAYDRISGLAAASEEQKEQARRNSEQIRRAR